MFTTNKVTLTGASLALGLTAVMSPIVPSAQAATLTYSGTTVGDPTWHRPKGGNPPTLLAGNGANNVEYDVFGFTVGTTGTYSLLSASDTPSGWDNFAFLYQNSFDPNNQLANILVGDNNKNGIVGLAGFNRLLTAGTNYFFVTTGTKNGDAGSFTNTIAGVGAISEVAAVPEPATILGSLVALGSGIYFKRKMQLSNSKKI